MKFVAAVAVVASSCLVGLVSAQAAGLARLPRCAQACVGSSVTVPGCSGLDIKCICQNRDFLTNISCCVARSCPAAEQQTTLEVSAEFCRNAGVTLPVTSASCPGASSSASPSPSPTTTGAAASVTSSAASAASSAASSASAAVSSFASSVSSAASSASSSASAAASSALASASGNAAPTAAPLAAHGLGLAGAAAVALALM